MKNIKKYNELFEELIYSKDDISDSNYEGWFIDINDFINVNYDIIIEFIEYYETSRGNKFDYKEYKKWLEKFILKMVYNKIMIYNRFKIYKTKKFKN